MTKTTTVDPATDQFLLYSGATLLIFGVPHIHLRRIWVQVEVLQTSQIKHRHVQALCMLLVD